MPPAKSLPLRAHHLGSGSWRRALEQLLERFLSLPPAERKKEFLSTFDAAEYFDMPQRTLQNWADLGYIQVLPIGRRNLVEIASISTFIVENAKVRLGL